MNLFGGPFTIRARRHTQIKKNNRVGAVESYGFVLVPLVTIVVAATIAGESITGGFLMGAVLVLAGVYVGALMPQKEKQQALWDCQDQAGEVLPRCV